MIATPKENFQRFKQKLAGFKRVNRFIGWRRANLSFRIVPVSLASPLRTTYQKQNPSNA
jgi:hypothetical protein